MNHIIITRISFGPEESGRKRMEEYLKVAKETFIPSLKAQTNQNFRLFVILNPHYINEISTALDYDFTPISDVIHSLSNYQEIVKIANAHIQTRHDIDDWMSPDYVKTIQEAYKANASKYDKFLIHAQPTKYDWVADKEYRLPRYTYPSMFLSLCHRHEPDSYIFDEPHTAMRRVTPNVVMLREGLTKWVFHGNNISPLKDEGLIQYRGEREFGIEQPKQ